MDDEVQETVEKFLGSSAKVIDCEKQSTIKGEEVLLVNGCPIPLDDVDGLAIREALLHGNVPDGDVLNHILLRAGILNSPVKLETSLSVKSSVLTKKEITVSKSGQVIDGYSKETKEDNLYASETSEIWQPLGISNNNNNKRGISAYSPIPAAIEPSFASFSLPSSTCQFRLVNSLDRNRNRTKGGGFLNNNKISDGNFDFIKPIRSKSPMFSDYASKISDFDFHLPNCPKNSKNLSSTSNDGLNNIYSSIICGPCKQVLQQANIDIKQINNGLSNGLLVYRDQILVSGDFGALLQHLVPTLDYHPSRPYCFTFLLTYRLFISPFDLLATFVAISDSQQNYLKKNSAAVNVSNYIKRLISVIKEWSEIFPYDFQDEYLMQYLQSLFCKFVTIDKNLKFDINQILRTLKKNLDNMNEQELYILSITGNTITDSTSVLDIVDLMEISPDPRILAENLCHIELEYLSHIKPEELIQIFSSGVQILDDSSIRSSSLKGYIQWFDRLSSVVSTEICKQSHKKRRVRIIEYWIEVARESFNIGNFNSLMSIISGLNTSPVIRLKRTWNKVQSAKFSVLEHQMDPTSNFISYRSTLKAAVWRSASGGGRDSKQQIVIPFFSLLIKDIYFLNECCVSKLPNGHVNFEKFWQLAKQIREFMKWKQVVCPFPISKQIIAFLQGDPVLSENGLALASFACEPPDGSVEKDRYKLLLNSSPIFTVQPQTEISKSNDVIPSG